MIDNSIDQQEVRSRLLVVDDDQSTLLVLKSILENKGYRVDCVSDERGLFECLNRYSFDAVFLDYRLNAQNGLELLRDILRDFPFTKVIIITAYGSVDLAVEAMQRGASGFIPKPIDTKKVLEEIEKITLRTAFDTEEDDSEAKYSTGIIGSSYAVKRIHEQIERMKDVESTVLITGESGTGKELIARSLHKLSRRSDSRFEAINCAAIPDTLLEAEMFGFKRGAFTDAKTDKKGLFEICHGGTLFLDEIGEVPLTLQGKLLRVLQEKVITPLGCTISRAVNTRIVAATNLNLEREVKEGRFRMDLFYRLSVLQIDSPPLRERLEDIPALAQFILRNTGERLGISVPALSPEVLARLRNYPWPGNIRELQNALERAMVMSQGDDLDLRDIFPKTSMKYMSADQEEVSFREFKPLTVAKEEFEKGYLQQLLLATKGNVSQAANISVRSRTDMYRLFSKYKIDPDYYKNR